jgi:hypothetical protein
MTVSTTTIKNSADGNGTLHSFIYEFKIFADGDLDVIVRSSNGTETVKALNTDYIVTNAGVDSGGNVLFKFNTGSSSDAHFSSSDKRPQSGETVLIRRSLDLTQSTDYVENDPFAAEDHETALDRLTFISQELQEELSRSIKISRTNTMTSTEFTTSSTDRANKILAFDSAGELAVTQELGTVRGNWAASTTYAQRDIVKDTSTNNIFIAITAHTSSGSQPLTSNTDAAKWSLLVDAATATTAAATATTKAGEADTDAGTATTKAGEADSSATAAGTSATLAGNYANKTDGQVESSQYSSKAWAIGGTGVTDTAGSGSAKSWAVHTTGKVDGSASNSDYSAKNYAISGSVVTTGSAKNWAIGGGDSFTTSTAVGTTGLYSAKYYAELAASSFDSFDDKYLGGKSSNPALDNDDNALATGALYFNTTDNSLRIYNGSAWVVAAVDTSSFATAGFSIAMATALG